MMLRSVFSTLACSQRLSCLRWRFQSCCITVLSSWPSSLVSLRLLAEQESEQLVAVGIVEYWGEGYRTIFIAPLKSSRTLAGLIFSSPFEVDDSAIGTYFGHLRCSRGNVTEIIRCGI